MAPDTILTAFRWFLISPPIVHSLSSFPPSFTYRVWCCHVTSSSWQPMMMTSCCYYYERKKMLFLSLTTKNPIPLHLQTKKKNNIYVFLIFYFSPSFSYVLRVVHSFHIQKWIEIVSVYFDFLLFVLSVPNQVGLRTTTNAGYLVGWTLFLEWNKFPTHHYQSLFHIHRML